MSEVRAVADDLRLIEARISGIVETSDPVASRYVSEVVGSGGKRLRPRLVMAFARIFSARDFDHVLDCAAACELLHTATLIHDDVIDQAEFRRGRPTLSSKYGNELAVTVGDYLLARLFAHLAVRDDARPLRLVLRSSQRLGQGAVTETSNRDNFAMTEDEYRNIIRLKTAELFAVCCELGAILGDAPADEAARAREFGEHFGLAFQMADDMLDVQADSRATGKPTFLDVREGRVTLPLIRALKTPGDEVVTLVKAVRETDSTAAERALAKKLNECGALAYVVECIQAEMDAALTTLDRLPGPPETHDAVRRMCDAVAAMVARMQA